MAHLFRCDDPILIRCHGRVVAGVVQLASPNGKSLVLRFEAVLEGHVGMMPVLLGDDGIYRSIMSGIDVTLTPPGSPPPPEGAPA